MEGWNLVEYIHYIYWHTTLPKAHESLQHSSLRAPSIPAVLYCIALLTPFKFNNRPLTVTKGDSPSGGGSCCPTLINWASTAVAVAAAAAWALAGIHVGRRDGIRMAFRMVARRTRREDGLE
eukprot:CCRYP_000519-RC/>CCRYP_000519-RC protein AED:0.47 eAED:1.00 QI:0/0/0/1/0/0/2/0/121